jgi:hypothetical protein
MKNKRPFELQKEVRFHHYVQMLDKFALHHGVTRKQAARIIREPAVIREMWLECCEDADFCLEVIMDREPKALPNFSPGEFLSEQEFKSRLINAGWTKHEADKEWEKRAE